MTIQEIAVKYKLSTLNGLYMKVSKDVQVYEFPTASRKWNGWIMKKGSNAGKLNMWIAQHMFDPAPSPPIDGIWFEFFVNDIRDFTNGKRYFIKFDPNMIDWEFTKTQLTAEKRANMTFYEGIFNDLEKDYTEWKDNVVDNVKNGIFTGLAVAAGMFLTVFVIIPEIKFRRQKAMFVDVAKALKS
jgi:hypothetical protein